MLTEYLCKKNSVAGGFTVKWGEAKYFSVSNFATNKINVPFLVGGICYLWIKTEMSHEIKNKIRKLESLLAFPVSHLASTATP